MTPELKNALPPMTEDFTVSSADTNNKRDKTRGEHLFNWSVYGGIGWVVNAAISLVALDWMEYSPRGQKVAEGGKNIIGGLLKPLGLSEAKHTKYKNMGFFITTLYSGGTLLVPVMKMFEDHKGWWVRLADRTLHGKAAETDPKLIEAHQEMDDAPKQSWGSMLKARAISLPAGLGLGFLVGNHDAFSTKIAEGSGFSKFSSFDRAGATIGRNYYEKHPPKAGHKAWEEVAKLTGSNEQSQAVWKKAIDIAREQSPHTTAVGLDPRRVRFGSSTVYELLLSSFVAAGFFFTSHAFASVRDKKIARREEAREETQGKAKFPVIATLPEASSDNPPLAANDDDKPASKVSSIRHDAQLAQAPLHHAAV